VGRTAAILIAMAALSLFSGCIIIPVPGGGHTGEFKAIDEATVKFIQIGTTTREDILLRLGAPDEASETTLTYGTMRRSGGTIWFFFIPIPSPGPAASLSGGGAVESKIYKPLIIEFDENSTVTAWRLGEGVTHVKERVF
jgi:hypothetical protein